VDLLACFVELVTVELSTICSLQSVHCAYRKQAWLWAQGDLYRARADCRPGVKSGVDDILTYTRRSPSVKRSVLKSRQEYEVDMDDDSVSLVIGIAMPVTTLLLFCIFISLFLQCR